MGSRGPVPKRSDQRRRTNKDPGGPVTKAPAGAGPPEQPACQGGIVGLVLNTWQPAAAVRTAADIVASLSDVTSQRQLAGLLAPHGVTPSRARMTQGGPLMTVYRLADFELAGDAAAPGGSAGVYEVPPADPLWHGRIQSLYEAAKISGQSRFWEPTDWEMLRVGCEVMSAQMMADKVSAVMFAAWDALMARLLMTEGDRRRMRLELERRKPEADPDEVAGVTSMLGWQSKLAGIAGAPVT